MKKIIAIIALSAAFAFSAAAQPKAIGMRFAGEGAFGINLASYEHYVGSPNFIEVEAGINWHPALGRWGVVGGDATFTYNFTFLQPNWTSKGEWGLYAGPGITGGYGINWFTKKLVDEYHYTYRTAVAENGGFIGLAAQVGLEYTFWFPLQIAVDIRPVFGVHMSRHYYEDYGLSKAQFYMMGMYGFIPSISVRYAF